MLPSDGESIDTETSNNIPPSEILLTPSKAKPKKTASKAAVKMMKSKATVMTCLHIG